MSNSREEYLVFELYGGGGGGGAVATHPGRGEPFAKLAGGSREGQEQRPPRTENLEDVALKRRALADVIAETLAEHEKSLCLKDKPRIIDLIAQDVSPNYKGMDFYGKVRKEVRAALERLGKAELNEVLITKALIELKLQDVPKKGDTRYDAEDAIYYKGPTTVLNYLKKQINSESEEDRELIDNYIKSDAFWYLWQNLISVIYALEKSAATETGRTLIETLYLPGTTVVDELKAEMEELKKPPEPIGGEAPEQKKETPDTPAEAGPDLYR